MISLVHCLTCLRSSFGKKSALVREMAFENNSNLSVSCSKAADTLGGRGVKAAAFAAKHHGDLKHINTSALQTAEHHLPGQSAQPRKQPGLRHKAIVPRKAACRGLQAQKSTGRGSDPYVFPVARPGLRGVFQEAQLRGSLSCAINFLIEAQIWKHIVHRSWTPGEAPKWQRQ